MTCSMSLLILLADAKKKETLMTLWIDSVTVRVDYIINDTARSYALRCCGSCFRDKLFNGNSALYDWDDIRFI